MNDGWVTIEGFLHSKPDANFRLEFFANTAAAPAGRAQGEIFLGALAVTNDNEGNAPFTITYPMETDQCPTATATGIEGSSAFTTVIIGPDDNGKADKSHCVFTNAAW